MGFVAKLCGIQKYKAEDFSANILLPPLKKTLHTEIS